MSYTPTTPAECLAEVDRIIANIKAMMEKPAFPEETSAQMRIRADRRRSMATSIRLNGGQVQPEYEPINLGDV
jgi:hypothetical protein